MILDIVWIRVILPAVFLYLILLNFIAQVIIGLFSNIEARGGVTLREIFQEIALAGDSPGGFGGEKRCCPGRSAQWS